MRSVCIGITVHAQPEQFQATLAALCEYTPPWVQLVLLPDGPDAATKAALARLTALPQLSTPDARGAAACFNRLADATHADVLVLLESGALVSPGWLAVLLNALDASPHNGLAGPSTNRCWNEQAAFPETSDDPASITCASREAALRFGDTTYTLAPLYSLADFCYAATRATIQAVGAADEGYGLGPCWEMDYNIRAARMGFRGVWACGAYVHRLPTTLRRQREETRLMTASRRRYQDRFCALRLSGRRMDYEPHCRGDACEHFAPADLMTPVIPLLSAATSTVAPVRPPNTIRAEPGRAMPLVSCIMPTAGRPEYVLQAVRYFQRQDYPERELIIVDDGPPGLAAQLPDDPRIHYQHYPQRRSIGAKRNQACTLAQGEYIAHWDDDDWYAPSRLSAQLAPLLANQADITGLTTGVIFDLDRWRFWRCSPDLHRRMFVEDVHGGTLVFRRRLWERTARYPDRSLAEDAAFLRQSMRYGARLHRLNGDKLFVYIRHGGNSWAFECGNYMTSNEWMETLEPALLATDSAFYRTLAPAIVPRAGDTQPLVSCIMPTADRRAFVELAIRYFQRQEYANRELIIVDDGLDPVANLAEGDPRIRYIRLDQRIALGEKRNIACRAASGELICHWDDDDWMAPGRIAIQARALLRSNAQACGAQAQLYYEPVTSQAWLYRQPAPNHRWVAGNTLMYRRALWERQPFAPLTIGEDTRFIWSIPAGELHQIADHSFYIGIIHSRNTAPKRTTAAGWHPRSAAETIELFGVDADAYTHLESQMC